jgi:hypothetical protein
MHFNRTTTGMKAGPLLTRGITSAYVPTIWIEHNTMFATGAQIRGKEFIEMAVWQRRSFENHLMAAMRDKWGVLAQNLRLRYLKGKVEIIFKNDEEFVMAKMSGGELNNQV